MPSLLDAIEKKYTLGGSEYVPQDESFILLAPKAGARATVPQVLVLDDCQVNCIGDEKKLVQLCSGIEEIDLSHNELNDWNEIAKMLRLYPTVKFLNLSFNNLSSPLDSSILQMDLPYLHTLILVSTQLQWSALWKLMDRAPALQEIHLSLNDFNTVDVEDDKQYPLITKVMFNGNNIGDWTEIMKLGHVFPNLKHLSLSETPITEIRPNCWLSFPFLESLALCNTQIKSSEDVCLLNNFPVLNELRLSGISLLTETPENDRRDLLIALLPKIKKLNGGAEIDPDEREGAERAYIRIFLNPSIPKTSRYHELVAQHGELEPLVEISLKPKKKVDLHIKFGDLTSQKKVNLYQTVRDFKKSLEPTVGLEPSRMELYHLDVESNFGRDILRFPNKFLYSYNMQDGDEIHVEIKNNTNRNIKR